MALDLAKTDWAFAAILDYMYAQPDKQTYEFNERVKRGLVSVTRAGKTLSRLGSSPLLKRLSTLGGSPVKQSSERESEESRKSGRPRTAKVGSRSTSEVLREIAAGRQFHELAEEAFQRRSKALD